MKIRKVMNAFYSQRTSAKRRGIPFHFTYEEWCGWWESKLGSDWPQKRGRGIDKYVMARNGDKGPYAPWNVEAVLHGENSTQTIANKTSTFGTKHGMCKLTEAQVLEIRNAEGLTHAALAQKFGVSRTICTLIRSGKRWGHL